MILVAASCDNAVMTSEFAQLTKTNLSGNGCQYKIVFSKELKN